MLVGCAFFDGSTILLVAQALSNLGHSVIFWNIRVNDKPPTDDYDFAIVWSNRLVNPESFGNKPNCYVYLDDPEYWRKENPQYDIEVICKDYKYVFTNMKWEGFDEKRYIFLPMGVLGDIHKRIILTEEDKKKIGYDILFIGTNRGNRGNLVKHIAYNRNNKYSVGVYGNGWDKIGITTTPAYFYDFSKLLSAAKIVITEHWKNGFSTNDCEKPAVGGALTITDCQIVKDHYPMMPMYKTYQEAVDLAHYYLEHEEERLKLVREMQIIAHANFSYEKQLTKLIKIVTGED